MSGDRKPILSAEEAIAILVAIDQGEDPIVEHADWDAVFAGDVRMKTAAGHELAVFNDCDSWDYVDHVTHVDGRTRDFDEDVEAVHPSKVLGGPMAYWLPMHPERWPVSAPTREWLRRASARRRAEDEADPRGPL